MKVGERIRNLRKEKGYTADDVAAKLGVSRSTIFRYENGDIEKVPSDIILELSTILGTTPAKIMGWDSEEKNIIKFNENSKSSDFPDHYEVKDILVAKEYLKFFDSQTTGYFTGTYDYESLSDEEIIQMANELKKAERIINTEILVPSKK